MPEVGVAAVSVYDAPEPPASVLESLESGKMGLQHLFAAVFYVREEGLVVAEHRDCNVRADFFEHSFQPLFMPQLFQREIQYLGYEGAVVGLVVDSEIDSLD